MVRQSHYLHSHFKGVCLGPDPVHNTSDEEDYELALGTVVDHH